MYVGISTFMLKKILRNEIVFLIKFPFIFIEQFTYFYQILFTSI